MSNFQFTNPGAAFSGGFEDYLMKQHAAEHQNMLEDLANKREQRLAQAELDSMAEHQDTLAQKKQKDQADQHDKEVKDFQAHVDKTYTKNDRPAPEDIATAQRLNLGGVFRQAAPVTSTDTSTMAPAALMEAPPAAATAAGTGADLADPNAAVTTPGAMTPGPMTFPGSVASREKDAQKADVMAFVQKLRDAGEGEKAQAIADAYEAEGLGLKTPAGLFNKGTTKSEAPILRQNPRTSKIDQRNDQTGEWEPLIGNAPPNAHWMTEAPPKDNSAHELASTLAHQHVVEKANKTLYDELGKGELAQIAASTGIQQALAQNNEVGDSVLAPMILKATVTAGGNSGFRMTKPEIDRVLTKPKSDALMLALNSWTGNGPLQITDTQRADMHKIATQIYERAKRSYGKLNDAEDQINEVPVGQYKRINDIVSKTKRAFAEDLGNAGSGDQKQGSVPEVVGDIEYDSNGLMVKKGGR